MNASPLRRRLLAATVGAVVAIVGPAGSAAAATQLGTPGTPVATRVTMTSAALAWTASTGPVFTYTVQVIDEHLGLYHDIGTTSVPSFTHTGLTPDKVYIYRVIANAQASSGYTASNPSSPLYVTTLPPTDSVPPTKPGKPTANPATTISATLMFSGSTDNNRVAGYVAQREIGGVWTDVATNNVTTVYLRDLTPSTTYTVVIVAFDANGNRSPRSDPLTFTTRATEPLPSCRIQLIPLSGQYLLNVSLENMTAATLLENWTVTFTMPAAHTLSYAFNVTISRSGDQATATPAVWFTKIGPGGWGSFGLNARYPAGSPLPSGLRLNAASIGSVACT